MYKLFTEYIPRIIHMVHVLLYFVVVNYWQLYPYPQGCFTGIGAIIGYDCPNASGTTLRNMGKCFTGIHKNWWYTPTTQLHKAPQKLYGRLTLKYFGKTWYTPCFLIPRFSVNKLSACTLCMMVTQLIYCPLRNLEVISQTCVFFKSILQMISKLSTSWEICLRWVPQNPIIDKSTLVQVMAWWCQATSHYMSQCWPRYKWP